jgi:hypothetical protein
LVPGGFHTAHFGDRFAGQVHLFQLLTNAGHGEIVTDSIEILPGYRSRVVFNFIEYPTTVVFNFIEYPTTVVFKPVIYLYPERDTKVSVQLQPAGAFTYTYPDYGKGWNGVAHPDGRSMKKAILTSFGKASIRSSNDWPTIRQALWSSEKT